ncbi:MAG: two-component system, NtrC family, response regulator HydG [Candidatus Sumerlaeota bacterium]|nr:two-component system, NtrC family, response regulator HydG [Candidatus Sumerlaeota bacterium]
MRAEDLTLDELVSFSDGQLSLHGRRLVIHSLHAFAHLRGDLVRSIGLEQTRRLLTRYGYYSGQADAAAMKRVYNWDSLDEWLLAGPRVHALVGVVRTHIRSMTWEPETKRFEMEITWRGSGEAEEHQLELGSSEEPICWMLTAYASGYASFCLGTPVYFIESQCRCQPGCRVCRATGRDEASWGEAITPHLPFYQSDDIIGKIQNLTGELKRQQDEIDRQRRRLERLRRPNAPGTPFIETRNPAFQRILDVADRVAPYDTAILITGESGTGKEVLARHIHRQSRRAAAPFQAINCGSLPETLLESELFGHRAGAFTGAVHDRLGLFEQASGGTLFLDEVGEMPPSMQVKLLRALQEKEIIPVGGNKPRKIDIRVLSATNRRLATDIRTGKFRDDLFYRLAVVELELPPLRERHEDLLPLARLLLNEIAHRHSIANPRLDPKCHDLLFAYPWPGNIRELANTLERALLLTRSGTIHPDHLPSHLHEPATIAFPRSNEDRPLADVERDHILTVLRSTDGNRRKAARILGIGETTLWRRLRQYGEE